MTPTEIRLSLRKAGYAPLPLFGKAPSMMKNWQERLNTNEDDIAMWAKQGPDAINTGVLTKITPAFDVDVMHPEAARAIEELVRDRFEERGYILTRIGKPPKRAIMFRTDQPFGKILASFAAPDGSAHKLEFLCDGQQIVVDGIHPDTKRPYGWHGGSPDQIPRDDLPYITAEEARQLVDDAAAVLVNEFGFALAGKANGKAEHETGADDGQRADWDALIRAVINGTSLHDSLRDLAASCVVKGMADGPIRDLLQGLMRASTAPRDDRWLDRYKAIPRDIKTAREKFGGKASGPAKPSTNIQDLKTMIFPPLKFVVPGIIVEGLTLFAGKPKIGKSWLLLHAAVAVARGGFTLGDIHCPEGDVLYCALEDNLRRVQSRLTKLLGIAADWPVRLEIQCEMPRLTAGGLDYIRQWIKSKPNARLVVIDTLAMVKSPKRPNQSDYDADYAAVLELRALAAKTGVAIVVVHHLRKAEADDAFDTVSGTLGLTGAPDSILILKRNSVGAVILHGRGRDLTEIEKAVTFNVQTCTWAITGEASEVQYSTERSTVLQAVDEAEEPIAPNAIAAATGMRTANVRKLLAKLAKDGAIEKATYGKYRRRRAA
jgi:hypothetical protein